jgi:hypothetical protein
MRALLTATAAMVAAIALAAPGVAQKPPKPGSITLKASADQVTFSNPVTLTGKVKGAKAGVMVSLERRSTDAAAFVPVATATTAGNGDFSFTRCPSKSTVYRATTTTPPATSAEVTIAVAPRVGLRVGDSTPRKGQRVRFRGTVRPQHDGMRVSIQRKRRDGTWAVVARPRLRDAGSAYSRYSKRLRIRRSGTSRSIIAAHADHAEGVSRERTLTVD